MEQFVIERARPKTENLPDSGLFTSRYSDKMGSQK